MPRRKPAMTARRATKSANGHGSEGCLSLPPSPVRAKGESLCFAHPLLQPVTGGEKERPLLVTELRVPAGAAPARRLPWFVTRGCPSPAAPAGFLRLSCQPRLGPEHPILRRRCFGSYRSSSPAVAAHNRQAARLLPSSSMDRPPSILHGCGPSFRSESAISLSSRMRQFRISRQTLKNFEKSLTRTASPWRRFLFPTSGAGFSTLMLSHLTHRRLSGIPDRPEPIDCLQELFVSTSTQLAGM